MQRELPIYEIEETLIAALRQGRRVIVQAPTGSGKSTQVPQMLVDRVLPPEGGVVVLQPRRLATRMLAARVAQERSVRLGGEVGYQIRFENATSRATRITYVTEGVLLRRMVSDPSLPGVSALIFDEFHERHLYGDITLARALDLQAGVRPDLLILVMSATLAAEQLETYLEPSVTIRSEGRTFPVTVGYTDRPLDPAGEPVWDRACAELERLVRDGAAGDALVFMPGAWEISRTCDALRASPALKGFLVLPLHGDLPPDQQDAAVARYERRKAVVSTNVAETSLTIDGVRIVIDSGLARIPRFDPYRGINTLLVERISRASADQRAGRAGRTSPGRCVRLWTEREHQARAPYELPEIKRLDLAEVALTLKAGGVDDLRAFRWLEPPPERSLNRAELLLKDLGALDGATGVITGLGRRMLSFPVHPRYARMLLAGQAFGCVRQAALIAALTQGRDLLVRRAGSDAHERRGDLLGESAESDFFMLIRAWSYADGVGYDLEKCRRAGIHAHACRQVRPLYDHFLRIAREEGLDIDGPPAADEAVQKCVLTGFSDELAHRLDTGTLRCDLVHGRRGELARESAVRHSPLIVAAEVREVEGRDRELTVLLTLATAVRAEWLRELYPGDYGERRDAVYDPVTRRVYAEVQTLFRDLVIESKRADNPPADAAAALLAGEVLRGSLTLKQWDHEVEQWIARVNFLADACPDLGVPPLSADDRRHIVEQVCLGVFSYKELKDKPVWPAVRSWLTPAQAELVDRNAPERVELPGGRRSKVTYPPDGPPYFSSRIQDLYGLQETPKIARGRIPLVAHILAPSHRPVQITRDLASFWKDHYPRIKQELQRKYPKHEWR
jgi:ATP-dependent helicase HrpB